MMVETFDAVVVGGGLGGIYMLHQYVSTVKKCVACIFLGLTSQTTGSRILCPRL